jgi:hypothetical protein
MNERVQETSQLEALLMGAPPGRVSTVHLHYGQNKHFLVADLNLKP